MINRMMPAGLTLAMLVAVMAGAGCSGPPEIRPNIQTHFDSLEPRVSAPSRPGASSVEASDAESQEPLPPLSLDDVVDHALARQPSLREAAAKYEAARGQLDQAGRWPNPNAVVALDDAPLDGKFFADAKYFLRLEQQLPISGRIGAAQEAAAAEVQRMRLMLTLAWRQVYRDAVAAYLAVDLARRRQEVAASNYEVAQRVHASIKRQVDAGATPGFQLSRATVALERTRIALTGAERAFHTSRDRLATAIGVAAPRIRSVLPAPAPATQDDDVVLASWHQHPMMLEALAAVSVAEGRASLAEARGNIDLGVFWRIRFLGGTDKWDTSFGFSIPLKLFDRNQGNRWSARAGTEEAVAHLERIELELTNAIASAREDLRARLVQWKAWHDEVLPAAQAAVAAAESGYQRGGFSELEVLEAQQELFAARDDSLDDLNALWMAALELHLLTADLRQWNPFGVRFIDPSPDATGN